MQKETIQEKKARQHKEDLERLKRFTPMDDTFMRCMFKGNIQLAELVLRIILGKNDLILTSCETQADMKRVTGAKSVCLDAYGTDNTGKKYDIEVQQFNENKIIKRARYYSSVLDIENLDAGQDFDELPDTYVIFIMRKDIFGLGRSVYKTKTVISDTEIRYEEGKHVIYVNGRYRGEDAIGKLMHDFNCSEAREMHYELMAERTEYLKESEKGVDEMCKISEEIREEGRLEGLADGRLAGELDKSKALAKKLFQRGITIEEIASLVEYDIKQVKSWLS